MCYYIILFKNKKVNYYVLLKIIENKIHFFSQFTIISKFESHLYLLFFQKQSANNGQVIKNAHSQHQINNKIKVNIHHDTGITQKYR